MNPRVQSILDVRPFKVKVRWTNGQITTIDFNDFLSSEMKKNHPMYSKLFNPTTFLNVKTDGRTLFWENLSEMFDEDGSTIPAPIDFCPDVLYTASKED